MQRAGVSDLRFHRDSTLVRPTDVKLSQAALFRVAAVKEMTKQRSYSAQAGRGEKQQVAHLLMRGGK